MPYSALVKVDPDTLTSVVEPGGTSIVIFPALCNCAAVRANTLRTGSVPVNRTSYDGPAIVPFALRSAHCAERSLRVVNSVEKSNGGWPGAVRRAR